MTAILRYAKDVRVRRYDLFPFSLQSSTTIHTGRTHSGPQQAMTLTVIAEEEGLIKESHHTPSASELLTRAQQRSILRTFKASHSDNRQSSTSRFCRCHGHRVGRRKVQQQRRKKNGSFKRNGKSLTAEQSRNVQPAALHQHIQPSTSLRWHSDSS